jgi:hypothetical protein
MRPSFPLLKPPLEVLETFGGAKVSDDDQLKAEKKPQKTRDLKIPFLKIENTIDRASTNAKASHPSTPLADAPLALRPCFVSLPTKDWLHAKCL